MNDTSRPVALAFGATGYTGRAVVRRWSASGPVVAHVRPDSPRGLEDTETFTAWGAAVREAPWDPAAICALVAETKPEVVFSLLGTTRERAKRELSAQDASQPYAVVDERLSVMAIEAVREAAPSALFVYLSALGVTGSTNNPYLKARYNVERVLAKSGLRHVIARPAFISGSDRTDFRLGERVASIVLDGAFTAAAFTGLPALRELRQQYASLSGDELAAALVSLGRRRAHRGEVLASELRKLAKRATLGDPRQPNTTGRSL